MFFKILFLTVYAVVCVNGQFPGVEYGFDGVPLLLRTNVHNARYEVQPSASQEIEYQGFGAARSSQGHRRRNIQNNDNNQNNFDVNPNQNTYQNDGSFQIRLNNPDGDRRIPNYREQNVKQFDAQIQQSHGDIREQVYQNTGNRNRNNGESQTYENNSNLKTNIDSTYSQQNTPNLGDILYNQQNYPSNDNIRDRGNPTEERNNNRDELRRDSVSKSDNNRNSDTRQVPENYENRPTDRRTNDNVNYGTDIQNTEPIERVTNNHSRAIESTKTNNNRNYATNTQTTKLPTRKTNKNRHSTESSRVTEDNIITGSTKTTQDNELAGRSPGGNMGKEDKWIWSDGSEIKTKSTVEPTLPTVDDRAAFAGDKCPTGQVRFNNVCVNTD